MKMVLLVLFFLISRVFLLNINSAEWGDSYRILRASNFVQHFSYPNDEKRPPLYSILLAIRPNNIDTVLWGRIFMLGISFLSIYIFYKLSKKYLATQNQRIFAVVLLALNPVYLYWSLRIYADAPFSLLVMLCFYVFELWREHLDDRGKSSILYLAVMGLICGLGILTRFEGYLLAIAALVGIVVIGRNKGGGTTKHSGIASLLAVARNDGGTVLPSSSSWRITKPPMVFLLTTIIVAIPWLIYRNPLTSSYFEETAGRKYNFEMLLTYFVSYIFVLGIIPAGSLVVTYFFKKPSMNLLSVFKKYPHIVTFVLLESLLILAWPAAVPRLFVPVIPFLVIAFVYSWRNDGEGSAAIREAGGEIRDPQSTMADGRECCGTRTVQIMGVAAIVLTAIYIIGQNHLRLQFLGPHTVVFVFVSAVSIVGILAIFLNQRKLFLITAILSMLALSASTIYLHKDIYRSIKEISVFSLREIAGNGERTIHNDTASIVNWYLPQSEYKNLDDKKYLTQDYLQGNSIDYIILTNEFDPNLEIDLKKRPYLTLIKESKYTMGGKMFFTWLIKVRK